MAARSDKPSKDVEFDGFGDAPDFEFDDAGEEFSFEDLAADDRDDHEVDRRPHREQHPEDDEETQTTGARRSLFAIDPQRRQVRRQPVGPVPAGTLPQTGGGRAPRRPSRITRFVRRW